MNNFDLRDGIAKIIYKKNGEIKTYNEIMHRTNIKKGVSISVWIYRFFGIRKGNLITKLIRKILPKD